MYYIMERLGLAPALAGADGCAILDQGVSDDCRDPHRGGT